METCALGHQIRTTCLSICPSMQLATVQLNPPSVWVIRKDGEIVWDLQLKEGIDLVIWGLGGSLLSLIGAKGTLQWIDVQNGERILEVPIRGAVKWGKWVQKEDNDVNDALNVSITDSITEAMRIDVDNILPTLKNSYNEHFKRDSLGVLTLSYVDNLSLIFNGSFIINIPMKGPVRSMASSGDLKKHFILYELDGQLQILKMETPFITKSLFELTSTYAQINSCVRLLGQCLRVIDQVYLPFVDYTWKIMELLGEDQSGDPIDNLYDLLLTGSISSSTKKWMTDYLGDRGIKRWTKLGIDYFDEVKKVCVMDLIPACTHLLTHLNKLKINDTTALELTKVFLKRSYKFIISVNEQMTQFRCTMQWLKTVLKEIAGDEISNSHLDIKKVVKFLLFVNLLKNYREGPPLTDTFEKLKSSIERVCDEARHHLENQVSFGGETSIASKDCIVDLKWKRGFENDTSIKIAIQRESAHVEIWEMDLNLHFLNKWELQIPQLKCIKWIQGDQLLVIKNESVEILSGGSHSSQSKEIFSISEGLLKCVVNDTKTFGFILEENRRQFHWIKLDAFAT